MATAPELQRDAIDELGIKLISADNHVNEPRNLFIDRFPKHLKDKAPRVIEGKDGGEGWSIDGVSPPKRTYGIEAMAGWDRRITAFPACAMINLGPGTMMVQNTSRTWTLMVFMRR